jgi:glycosyltransferase involved in cell wall biosynthesis
MGFFYSGGGERTVLCQAKGLQEKGHDVKIFTPIVDKKCFPELTEKLEIIQISRKVLDNMPLNIALKMIDSSILVPFKEFKDREILVAHGQPSNWIAYKISKKIGIPYISYLHQANRFLHPRKIDEKTGWSTDPSLALLNIIHKKNTVIQKLDEISIKSSKNIITNSNWIRLQINKAYNKNSVICYPGVDEDKFKPSLTKTPQYILTTNRHIPQKRIDYLLKCMKIIVKEKPDTKCLITGESTAHTKELKETTSRLYLKKNVIFTGKLTSEQLVSAYQSAYTYSYTSPEEDFGLGPLEAGACGVPSIVWDYAGPRETVLNNKTGFKVKPYDINAMAKKHIELLENPRFRNNLGKNARKYVTERFTWKQHCDKLEKILEKTLS